MDQEGQAAERRATRAAEARERDRERERYAEHARYAERAGGGGGGGGYSQSAPREHGERRERAHDEYAGRGVYEHDEYAGRGVYEHDEYAGRSGVAGHAAGGQGRRHTPTVDEILQEAVREAHAAAEAHISAGYGSYAADPIEAAFRTHSVREDSYAHGLPPEADYAHGRPSADYLHEEDLDGISDGLPVKGWRWTTAAHWFDGAGDE